MSFLIDLESEFSCLSSTDSLVDGWLYGHLKTFKEAFKASRHLGALNHSILAMLKLLKAFTN